MMKNQPYRSMLKSVPDILDVPQMCEVLSISKKTAYALLQNGDIQHIKVGRAYRIPKLCLIDYLTNS